MSANARCVFTVDVEDWFHILDVPSTPPLEQWAALPSRVEASFQRMLAIMAQHGVKGTMFLRAGVAERCPHLVKEAEAQGHEIASHGYAHELVFRIGRERFRVDIERARKLLEDISGSAVRGYRAPGFSATAATPWFMDEVAGAGYTYDSSIWPGSRNHGGMPGALATPYTNSTAHGPLLEFPISMGTLLGRPMYFFGGGYLRFFPYPVINNRVKKVLSEDRPVIFYLHPREVDPDQPRLHMSAKRRFMSYTGLRTTEPKMHRLFSDHRFSTFAELMQAVPPLAQVAE